MAKRRRRAGGSARPKGSYPLPTGGYVSASTYRSARTGRLFRIRAAHRAEVDPKAVAQVLIALAIEQARDDKGKRLI
jgi:hypothetical protein